MIYRVKYCLLLTSTFNDCRVNISTCSNRDKKRKQKQTKKNKQTKQNKNKKNKTKKNKNKKKKKKTRKKNDRLTQNFEVCYTSIRIFSGLERGS